MLSRSFVIKIYTFVSVFFKSFRLAATFLLYPNTSWLQITCSISYPIIDLSLHRSVLFDWGFQMNYNFPFDVSSFYNAPIWKLEKRDVHNNFPRNYNDLETMKSIEALQNWFVASKDKHFYDFTAGQLYSSLENLIVSYGFHSSCLLQSVCEIAKYPFVADERHLLQDLLTFLLTPSWHLGFAAGEDVQRKAYERAEWSGMHDLNCKRLYPACRRNFLRIITEVIFDNTL